MMVYSDELSAIFVDDYSNKIFRILKNTFLVLSKGIL